MMAQNMIHKLRAKSDFIAYFRDALYETKLIFNDWMQSTLPAPQRPAQQALPQVGSKW